MDPKLEREMEGERDAERSRGREKQGFGVWFEWSFITNKWF